MTSRLATSEILLIVLAAQVCRAQAVPRGELERRIAFANEHLAADSTPTTGRFTPGSQTDRGKAYIALGPPDRIIDNKSMLNIDSYPWEEWTYQAIPGIGTNVHIDFVDVTLNRGYRMIIPPKADVDARRRYELIRKRIRRVIDAAKLGPEEKSKR